MLGRTQQIHSFGHLKVDFPVFDSLLEEIRARTVRVDKDITHRVDTLRFTERKVARPGKTMAVLTSGILGVSNIITSMGTVDGRLTGATGGSLPRFAMSWPIISAGS